jgi:phosphoribosylanthranilate isomerase
VTRVKICGLTSPEQASFAASLGVDFIGLVFAEQSRRRVTIHQARASIAGRPPPATVGKRLQRETASDDRPPLRWFESSAQYFGERLQRKRPLVVGVFADMPATIVNAIADRVGLDLVQLSGNEPWEEALAIRRPVIKALRVGPTTSASSLLEEVEVGTANLCLLDTQTQGLLGGTGRTFDWNVAADLAREMPLILAGGLTPENVGQAISIVGPWGVDVSSGVELDGVKSEAKVRDFVASVRQAKSTTG